MRRIIITDLTRFNSPDIVCTAGTDVDSGQCIRPMPYLKASLCEKLEMLPGATLKGDFVPAKGLAGPHREDATYTPTNLSFEGPSSSADFRKALEAGLHDSVESGFEIDLGNCQKHIPIGHGVKRSIITLAVDPKSVEIVEDRFKAGKTKIHFIDGAKRKFSYMPITDLGFYRYADTHRAAKDLERLNKFIRGQPETYIRLGLSRSWTNPQGIAGYWMQVNGVYTFPKFFEDIRSYK